MLFHSALHLVFTTFSRSVLREGRLTNYMADCGVFDMFDDRRTICQLIDKYYGVALFDCLSHSPYKAAFDAMLQNAQRCHPELDPEQIAYVFHSVRFAWGKIKTIRPPKPPVLFAPKKKKRRPQNSPSKLGGVPVRGRGLSPRRPSPKRRPKRRPNHPAPRYTILPNATPRPQYAFTPQQRQRRAARVVLYFLAVIFTFCSTIMYNSDEGLLGTLFLTAAGTCAYILYRYLK